MCTYLLALKDGAKVQGWQKNGIGLCQLPVGVGGALRVCSGWDCREKREGVER